MSPCEVTIEFDIRIQVWCLHEGLRLYHNNHNKKSYTQPDIPGVPFPFQEPPLWELLNEDVY